jgi:hypothetical protein
MDLIGKIRDQIAFHRAELLRLESALEVIAEVGGKPAKASGPLITVRKMIDIDHEAAPAKAAPRRKHKVTPQQIDAQVIAYVKAHGPSRSADIGKAVNCDSKRLWSRLWAMNKAGTLTRDGNVYSLPEANRIEEERAA